MTATNWLEELYESQRRRIFGVAWCVLHDRQAAEDAVHSAFCRLLQLKVIPAHREAYVLRAVRNAALDARRQAFQNDGDSTILESVQDRPSVSKKIEQAEEAESLLSAVAPRDREIIELHLQQDMTFREIGELLDCPLQTIAARYRRAMVAIRESAGSDWGSYRHDT